MKPELILQVDQSIQAFDIFLNSLPLPEDELTGNLYHIITAIGRVAIKNYSALRQAFDGDCHELLAWSCRNLLELNIFTKYVLISKANADEFAGHRLIDGLEIAECLKEFALATNVSVAVRSLEPTICEFHSAMAAAGIVRSPHLSAERLAQAVNMKDIYKAMNKVCSKMVHPTAWAILTDDLGSNRFAEARQIFYGSGSEYIMETYISLKDHVRKFGLKHRPTAP